MPNQGYQIAIQAAYMKYAQYLKGKSVAFVGRSGYILQRKGGVFIDSHDIVVRINDPSPYTIPPNMSSINDQKKAQMRTRKSRGPFVPLDYQNSIGTRTSIFYTVHGWTPIIDPCKQANVQFIVSIRHANQRATLDECQTPIPILPYTKEQRRRLTKQIGSLPYGGTTALDHLLKFDLKTIYLTGFRSHFDRPDVWVTHHHGINDFLYMRNVITTDTRVTADNYMLDLFEEYDASQSEK